jgi:hypothetical protein
MNYIKNIVEENQKFKNYGKLYDNITVIYQ